MIRHLLRLIWNRKRKNILLIVEVCLAFLVLFAVFSIGVYHWQNYKKPLGYNYENVWTAYTFWEDDISNTDIKAQEKRIKQAMLAFPEIEQVAYSSQNIPFGNSNMLWGIDWKDRSINFNRFVVDVDFFDLMETNLIKGRFFTEEDKSLGRYAVITSEMEKVLFPNGESAVGESIPLDNQEDIKILGVIDWFRYQNEFAEPSASLFLMYDYDSKGYPEEALLMKVAPGSGPAFEERLLKELHDISPGYHFTLSIMDDQRLNRRREELLPITIFLIVASFLIINVALGLFGVLWYNVNSRRSEIGLRRAMGASAGSIVQQIIQETLLLVGIAMVIGVVVAMQLPILKIYDVHLNVYLWGIFGAALFLGVIVLMCAWYPGKKASEIQPAIALHEN